MKEIYGPFLVGLLIGFGLWGSVAILRVFGLLPPVTPSGGNVSAKPEERKNVFVKPIVHLKLSAEGEKAFVARIGEVQMRNKHGLN